MTDQLTRKNALKNQIRRLNNKIDYLTTVDKRFSVYRLISFITGIILGLLFYHTIHPYLGWSVLSIGLISFIILVLFHHRVSRHLKKNRLWLNIKTTHLARMQLDWQQIPLVHNHEHDPGHPFEQDLDISGSQSLLHLIDVTVSTHGHQQLKKWLLETNPDIAAIQSRQQLIKELVSKSRFRDKLLLHFNWLGKDQLNSHKLLNWLQKQSMPKSLRWLLPCSFILISASIVLFILANLNLLASYWILTLVSYILLYFSQIGKYQSIMADAMTISDELAQFKKVLLYLEQYPYTPDSHLKNLCQPFIQKSRPSKKLRALGWLEFFIGLRMNPIIGLFLNIIFPWDFYFAKRLFLFKSNLKEDLKTWLDVLLKLEAFNSIANFAYLNPDYSFPVIEPAFPSKDKILFQAKNIAHPLIPKKQKKSNDFKFKSSGETVIITGSNMSGKSTFLKTLGINLCLAYAGSAVNAEVFRTQPFRLYSSMKITDSLSQGVSFFYAEVKRLKSLWLELCNDQAHPIFFLIDEIFRGTNNRERLLGSRSYIQSLTDLNGIGVIATHDLELTHLDEQISKITNYHFRDEVQNGKMLFDYKLHSGPCSTTNALKIMKQEGLPI